MNETRKAARAARRKREQRTPLKVDDVAFAMSMARPERTRSVRPFAIPGAAKGVLPEGAPDMAADSQIVGASAWAGGYYGYAFTEGLEFLGYPYLSELAQRPEYRRMVEVIATEMTRKWIELKASGNDDKTEKIKAIADEMERLQVQAAFKKMAEQDGFFGRAHLYIDTGDTDDPIELKTDIGDGRNAVSKNKVGEGELKAVRPVEAVWTYPTDYNSADPLRGDWYKPSSWFVMGKQVHSSRLLTFIGREVPDLLKPAYSFGGLALTQMAKPYVDNWLQTRQSVNDIISAFTVFILKTNMAETLQMGGEQLFRRAALFNNLRNNRGLMMLDKEQEEFENVAAPLAGLHELQAQAQEHQCSVSGIPLVKFTGITPSGLNSSSDGEIRVFYDWIAAYQVAFFKVNLTKVIDFIQLSLYGDVDKDITFEFVQLYELNEKEEAEVEKIKAETGSILINDGVLDPAEERQRIAADPGSDYASIDVDDMPEFADEEQEIKDLLLDKKGGEGGAEAVDKGRRDAA